MSASGVQSSMSRNSIMSLHLSHHHSRENYSKHVLRIAVHLSMHFQWIKNKSHIWGKSHCGSVRWFKGPVCRRQTLCYHEQLMNVGSSKSPVAGRQINETKFSWLKTGKWDLWCSAAGLRGAPSPDLQRTLTRKKQPYLLWLPIAMIHTWFLIPFGYLILIIMCEPWY